MKDIKQTIDKLWEAMINYEWFADKILPHPTLHNALIVYVDTASEHIYRSIPDSFDGYDLRVHFIHSIGDKYAAKVPGSILVPQSYDTKIDVSTVVLN